MDGITIPKIENVKLLDRFNTRHPAVGILYLTATHLIFVDVEGKRESWILHMHIGHVEKLPLTTGGSPLLVRCKNFLCATFVIGKERECQDVYQSLLKLSRPGIIDELYAFTFKPMDNWPQKHGWDFHDLRSEYLRMGVPSDNWVLSFINENYELCDTYPSLLYIPASVSTHVLIGSSKFRSRGRLPALSYLHRGNQAAVTRCSQPLVGFSARCVEDEHMLEAVLKANPNSKFMYVVDTRPKINAFVNKAQGKGYENEGFYANIKYQFLSIDNIHVMRSSLQKLVEVCELRNATMTSFLQGLEGSGWLKHISNILESSMFIVNAICDGISVLVHCSDGWDRTAQTCSLSSLIMDPYYRTISGFMMLIEKEWLAFGYKFTDRCNFLDSVDGREVSPVFTQFLDCVWQLTEQFPCSFQFNERFLLTIFDHAYSCQFGTFIGNCEKDRVDLRLSQRTYSLWGYISRHRRQYVNPLFRKECEVRNPVLKPDTASQCFRFWRGMYNRFENGVHPRESIVDVVSTRKDHIVSMVDHAKLLEHRISELCTLLDIPGCEDQGKLQCLPSTESMHSITGDSLIGSGESCSPQVAVRAVTDGLPGCEIGCIGYGKSDPESGFDELSSQTSRSVIDELPPSPHAACRQCFGDIGEVLSVTTAWKSTRDVSTCHCAVPFDHYVKKFHCWRCGEVFCEQCISATHPLPGHHSLQPVPVCKPCHKGLRASPHKHLNS